MVEVIYEGRLGNRFFQYCFGRILAEHLGFRLKADPIPGFPNTKAAVNGFDYSGYPTQVLAGQRVNLGPIFQDISKRKIVLKGGFFQRYEYYRDYKEKIKQNWLLTAAPKRGHIKSEDIVLHIRRCDYARGGHAQPFSYFKKALSFAKYDRVFICTDGPDDPFMRLFKEYKPTIFHEETNPMQDFWFIMSFSKIIQSASSFSWWAGFLSDAKEIYAPVPKTGHWSSPEINLRVNDEDRYVYIKCNERTREIIRYQLGYLRYLKDHDRERYHYVLREKTKQWSLFLSLLICLYDTVRLFSSFLNKINYITKTYSLNKLSFFKIKEMALWREISRFNKTGSDIRLRVPEGLQPFWASWEGYNGPWVENYFTKFWYTNEKTLRFSKIGRIYIPIWWTDCYHRYGRGAGKKIQDFIDENIKPDKKYFTIVQNDDGILEKVPDNVLVFAAGGMGNIPIPLLKGNLYPRNEKRDIPCSFMGGISGPHDRTGVRSKMLAVLKDKPGFYFGKGRISDFIAVTSRSVFALCPRGYGKTSFRLYEVMALGAIPIYIWDDLEWLPYKNKLNWNNFSISINIKDIGTLPEILAAHNSAIIKDKQRMVNQLHEEYFTMEGVCNQIIAMLENINGNQNI